MIKVLFLFVKITVFVKFDAIMYTEYTQSLQKRAKCYRIFHGVITSFISTTLVLSHLTINVIASSAIFGGRFQSISSLTPRNVVHRVIVEHYQQIGTFISLVKCLEYAVDAVFIHRFDLRHFERCDNHCYHIKYRHRGYFFFHFILLYQPMLLHIIWYR